MWWLGGEEDPSRTARCLVRLARPHPLGERVALADAPDQLQALVDKYDGEGEYKHQHPVVESERHD